MRAHCGIEIRLGIGITHLACLGLEFHHIRAFHWNQITTDQWNITLSDVHYIDHNKSTEQAAFAHLRVSACR
jgi:hypothetical protein